MSNLSRHSHHTLTVLDLQFSKWVKWDIITEIVMLGNLTEINLSNGVNTGFIFGNFDRHIGLLMNSISTKLNDYKHIMEGSILIP